jgi:hypothetical protein
MDARLGKSANSRSSVHSGAPPGDTVLRQTLDAPAGEFDGALCRRHQAHDRLHRRGFSRAVAAEQRHHFAGTRLERDIGQDVGAAVIGMQAGDGEHQWLPPR